MPNKGMRLRQSIELITKNKNLGRDIENDSYKA